MGLQFLQSELKRVSEWIKFCDQKSAFLSVFYSAIFGLLISHKEEIVQIFKTCGTWLSYIYFLILVGILISSAIGLFLLFKSIFPRLKNSFTDKSLFYFGHIANMKFIDFSDAIKGLSDDDAKKQITEQIYTNSVIADQKMKNVQNSTKSLFVLIVLMALLIFLFL